MPNSYLNRLHVIVLFFSLSSSSAAQPAYQSLHDNLSEIKSINPIDNDFKGYDRLFKQIGDARIVMLGEQTHGHGTTFTAKIKLVKYLIEKMGFDVIAFESSFYEINKIWDSNLEPIRKIDSVRREVYGVWSNREEMNLFFEYLKTGNSKTKQTFGITGIDCKHEMPYGQKNYVKDFDDFLSKNKVNIPSRYSEFKVLLTSLIKGDIGSKASLQQIRLFNSILFQIQNEIKELQKTNENEVEVDLWEQELNSLKKQSYSCWILSKERGVSRFAARDSAMAENLLWLSNKKYKDRKIIVWAASYHIAKNKAYFEKGKKFDVENLVTMGDIVNSNMPNNVYSLGFVSSEGRYSESEKDSYPINVPSNSFEANLAKTGWDYAFIDLRTVNNDKKFSMAGIDYFQMNAVWNKIFDGLFYIRKMTPPTYIRR